MGQKSRFPELVLSALAVLRELPALAVLLRTLATMEREEEELDDAALEATLEDEDCVPESVTEHSSLPHK